MKLLSACDHWCTKNFPIVLTWVWSACTAIWLNPSQHLGPQNFLLLACDTVSNFCFFAKVSHCSGPVTSFMHAYSGSGRQVIPIRFDIGVTMCWESQGQVFFTRRLRMEKFPTKCGRKTKWPFFPLFLCTYTFFGILGTRGVLQDGFKNLKKNNNNLKKK